jgi:hypothetical protein
MESNKVSMSAQEIFELTGAGAGLISLIWQIASQLFGAYEIRIIREVVDRQDKRMDKLIDRIEGLSRSRQRGRVS